MGGKERARERESPKERERAKEEARASIDDSLTLAEVSSPSVPKSPTHTTPYQILDNIGSNANAAVRHKLGPTQADRTSRKALYEKLRIVWWSHLSATLTSEWQAIRSVFLVRRRLCMHVLFCT